MPNEVKGPYSEIEVIESILHKDKKGFYLLYDKYAAALFGIIYRITGDEGLSETLLQQCFCVFWDTAESLQPLRHRVFTKMVQIAGLLARKAMQEKATLAGRDNFVPEDKENNKFATATTHSVIDLIYINGYTLNEALERSGYCAEELKAKLQSEISALRTR